MSFLTRGEYKFNSSIMSTTTTQTTSPTTTKKKSDQHTTAMRSLKKLVKPLLRLIRKKQLLRKTLAEIQQQNAYNDSLEDMRRDAALNATDDNLANEQLEQRLYSEIRQCPADAAIIVDGRTVVAVQPQQQFIPVHFARTAGGTFFWTSVDVVAPREQELRLRAQLDRWGQA